MNERNDRPAPKKRQSAPALLPTAMIADAMAATLIVARALLVSGHRIDLDGVEREIGDLCAETVALPRDEGVLLRPALEQLLREVEALESDLAARLPGPAAL